MSFLATLDYNIGPTMIRDENGFLTGYVYLDTTESDLLGFVNRMKTIVDTEVQIPKSVFLEWSGQYENIIRVRNRMMIVVPITLVLYFSFYCISIRSLLRKLRLY